MVRAPQPRQLEARAASTELRLACGVAREGAEQRGSPEREKRGGDGALTAESVRTTARNPSTLPRAPPSVKGWRDVPRYREDTARVRFCVRGNSRVRESAEESRFIFAYDRVIIPVRRCVARYPGRAGEYSTRSVRAVPLERDLRVKVPEVEEVRGGPVAGGGEFLFLAAKSTVPVASSINAGSGC